MKPVRIILASILALLILFSVSVDLRLPDAISDKEEDTLPPASVSLLYRDAEKILVATCLRKADPEAGRPLAKFRTDEVLDGQAEEGATFDIAASAELGGKYLLYIAPDGENSVILTGDPVPIINGSAEFGNAVCTIDSIKRDIEEQRKILTVPSQSFFYGEFGALANACDEILLGRVIYSSGPEDTLCRSVDGGESTLSTQKQVFLRVRVENGLFGSFRCGDKLDIVLSPYNARPVINAVDLTPKTVDVHPAVSFEVGERCVFFLIKSEDIKSDYYFTVNPYEGYVVVKSNAISRPYYNDAMHGVNDIKQLSKRLFEALFPAEPPAEGEG